MASEALEPKSPILANVVVVAGFVVLFTTFVTESHWSWIIGGAMLLAGALWAGARTTDADVPLADSAAPQAPMPDGGDPPAPGSTQPEDDTEGHGVVPGPVQDRSGGPGHGRTR